MEKLKSLPAILTVLVVVGACLRAIPMIGNSMWIDDGATLHTVGLGWGEVVAERFRMGHFPWFFLLFKGWTALTGTSSQFLLRTPALVASLSTIPVIAFLARRIGGNRAAIAAAALAVIHGSLLRSAAELRMYCWLALIGVSLVLAVVRLAESPTVGRAVAVFLLHLAFLQLHVSSLVWAVPFFLCVAALARARRADARFWRAFWWAALLPILITIPVLAYLRMHVDMREFQKFDRLPAWSLALRTPYELVVALGATANGPAHAWKMLAAVALPFLSLMIIRRWPAAEANNAGFFRPADLAVLCVVGALAPPTIAFAVSRVGFPILGEARYYIAGTGPLIAVLGAAVVGWRWSPAWSGRVLVMATAVMAGVCAERGYDRVRGILMKDGVGVNTLVATIEAKVPAGTPIILCHSVAFPEIAEFYFSKPLRYSLVPVDRNATDAQIRETLSQAVMPDRDAVLFLYKMKPEREEGKAPVEESALYRILFTEFGPWSPSVEHSRNDDPGYFWFHRP